MNRNNLLYNAAMALVECSKYIKPVDREYAQSLLDQAEKYSKDIVIDEKLEQEVNEFEQRIREGID